MLCYQMERDGVVKNGGQIYFNVHVFYHIQWNVLSTGTNHERSGATH